MLHDQRRDSWDRLRDSPPNGVKLVIFITGLVLALCFDVLFSRHAKSSKSDKTDFNRHANLPNKKFDIPFRRSMEMRTVGAINARSAEQVCLLILICPRRHGIKERHLQQRHARVLKSFQFLCVGCTSDNLDERLVGLDVNDPPNDNSLFHDSNWSKTPTAFFSRRDGEGGF